MSNIISTDTPVRDKRGWGTYRFIEEQQWWVLQDQSRHSKPLLFTTTDHHATLANHGIVSIRESSDGVMYVCSFRCLYDLLLGRFHVTVLDVMPDSVVEQWRVLRYDTNRLAQALELDVTDILTVNRDASLLGVVVTEE